jgi:hypothetical protein
MRVCTLGLILLMLICLTIVPTVWAAPGQSPDRQTVPTRGPSRTPIVAPPEPPAPPGQPPANPTGFQPPQPFPAESSVTPTRAGIAPTLAVRATPTEIQNLATVPHEGPTVALAPVVPVPTVVTHAESSANAEGISLLCLGGVLLIIGGVILMQPWRQREQE